MRKTIFFLLILLTTLHSLAQISPLISKERMGDTVTITGRIYAGNYLKNVITKPTFLNVYDANPNRMLMLRIDSSDRKNFSEAPEKKYLNKKVTIRGRIDNYKGVATITLTDEASLFIDPNDLGPEVISSTGNYMSGQSYGFGKEDNDFRKKQDSIKAILDADTSRRKKLIPKDTNKIDALKPAIVESVTPVTLDTIPTLAPDSTFKKENPAIETVETKEVLEPAKTTPLELPKPETTEPNKPETKENPKEIPAETPKAEPVEKPKQIPAEKPTPEPTEKPKEIPAQTPGQERQSEPVVEEKEQAKPLYEAPEVKENKETKAITILEEASEKAEEIYKDEKPEKTKRIRLKNLPIKKSESSVLNSTDTATIAKAAWLKTISKQDFELVNDLRIVETEEIELRSSPTMDAPVIAYIMNKMTVLITFKSDKWSYLTVENPDGTKGMSGFIKNKSFKYLKMK